MWLKWRPECCIRYWKKSSRKFPNYSDTQKICCNHSKIWTMWLYYRVMSPNDADGMANSVDPDQSAPRSSLIWVCTVCPGISVRKLGNNTIFTGKTKQKNIVRYPTIYAPGLMPSIPCKGNRWQTVTKSDTAECWLWSGATQFALLKYKIISIHSTNWKEKVDLQNLWTPECKNSNL